jgi:hypothetical protein
MTLCERRGASARQGIDTLATNEPGRVLDWVMQPISYARHRFTKRASFQVTELVEYEEAVRRESG